MISQLCKVCDTAVALMLNSVSDDLRTALVCETFGDLTTQDKAGVLFTTGDDVRMGYLA